MSSAPRVPDTPPEDRTPMTLPRLLEMKQQGRPIVMITAYDYPSATVVEEAGVDLVLVGDSGAMTVLGHESTVPVGMDEMLMLAAAVRRGLKTPLLVGDMPFGSYEQSNEQAVANAQRFVKEAGCEAVKLERGGASVDRARAWRRRRPAARPRRPPAARAEPRAPARGARAARPRRARARRGPCSRAGPRTSAGGPRAR